jgi:hypothetical protein
VNPDNAAGTRSIAGVHFTEVMNIFDLITGAIGVLCALGGSVKAPATGLIR